MIFVVDENGILIVSELLWSIVWVVVGRVSWSQVYERASNIEIVGQSVGDGIES